MVFVVCVRHALRASYHGSGEQWQLRGGNGPDRRARIHCRSFFKCFGKGEKNHEFILENYLIPISIVCRALRGGGMERSTLLLRSIPMY